MTLPKRYGNKVGFLQNHGLGYNHVTMVTLHAKSSVSQVFIRNQPHAMVEIFISCCHVFLTFCRENPTSKTKIHPFHFRQTLKNYFTSSDPHHDMLGGGCQVRVVIENMMGRMENLRTLISGFLGLVILVRWALVTMFLS